MDRVVCKQKNSEVCKKQNSATIAADGRVYPYYFVRSEGDLLQSVYCGINFNHELSVERIVDERVNSQGRKQYKVKFVGVELDKEDWYGKDEINDVVLLEQWETKDKKILQKMRSQNGVQKIVSARKMVPSQCDTSNLDTLAHVCNLQGIVTERKKRNLDDFQYLLNEMTIANNGLVYPQSWLYTEGDLRYCYYKDIAYEDEFDVERIVDSFEIEGQASYLVKFVGFEICCYDLLKEKELSGAKEILQQWKKSGQKQLKQLREAFKKRKSNMKQKL